MMKVAQGSSSDIESYKITSRIGSHYIAPVQNEKTFVATANFVPLANNGQVAAIYFCEEFGTFKSENLWMLSRTQTPNVDQVNDIKEILASKGISMDLQQSSRETCGVPKKEPMKHELNDHLRTLPADRNSLKPEQIAFLRCVQELEAMGLHKFISICFDRS